MSFKEETLSGIENAFIILSKIIGERALRKKTTHE